MRREGAPKRQPRAPDTTTPVANRHHWVGMPEIRHLFGNQEGDAMSSKRRRKKKSRRKHAANHGKRPQP